MKKLFAPLLLTLFTGLVGQTSAHAGALEDWMNTVVYSATGFLSVGETQLRPVDRMPEARLKNCSLKPVNGIEGPTVIIHCQADLVTKYSALPANAPDSTPRALKVHVEVYGESATLDTLPGMLEFQERFELARGETFTRKRRLRVVKYQMGPRSMMTFDPAISMMEQGLVWEGKGWKEEIFGTPATRDPQASSGNER